jgi:nucleotide-binding universal stress UspA family protein
MRSILIYADRGPAMAARLGTGLAFARANGGHVTVLVDTPVTRFMAMDPMGGSFLATDALQQALSDDDAHAKLIEQQLSGGDIPFDVVRSEAGPVDALARAARLADMVVLSRSTGLAGEVALVCRTPVLVVEDSTTLPVPVANACVGWDGGDEAAHALRSAVPVLQNCGAVHIVTVQEKLGGRPGADALRYLSRYGIRAELHEMQRTGTTEETIAAAVQQVNGQLLVMGAYGHSRMRQYFFGGVTRYFLEQCSAPALLLTH